MYCPNCGTQLPEDALFCSSCGKSIKKVNPQTTENIVPANEPEREEIFEKPGRKKPRVVLTAAVAAAVVVGVVGAGLWSRNGNAGAVSLAGKNKTSSETSSESDSENRELNEEVVEEEAFSDIYTQLNVREDILAAINASRLLSGKDFAVASDGGYICGSSCQNFAYCYYGKDVTGVYADASSDPLIVATMADGSVYCGMTFLAEDCNIIDVAFKTHNTNIDAYMLGSDGQLYYYDPYNKTDDGRYENYFSAIEGATGISAICRAQSYPIFFYAEGSAATPGLMSGGSGEWGDLDVSDWEGIVVAACAYGEYSDLRTIAGISADGTVYAVGDYAEDILAMGDLVYITMTDEASLIVGLTPEGTLEFAGSLAEYYKNFDLDNLAGVKAFDDELWAIGTDGTIYEINVADSQEDIRYTAFSPDGVQGKYSSGDYYMSSSGEVFRAGDTGWETSDKTNASIADPENILYYQTLSTGKFNAGRSFTSSTQEIADDAVYTMLDLNEDGQKELILKNSYFSYYVLCVYDGEVSTSAVLYGDELDYYPELQLLVTHSGGSGYVSSEAGYLIDGQYTCVLTWSKSYEYGFAEGSYTGEEELPYTDEEGDNLRETYEYYISSAEFDALEEMIFGDATPQTVSDFTDYAEDTLAEVFLN